MSAIKKLFQLPPAYCLFPSGFHCTSVYHFSFLVCLWGAGIAQWLERRTCYWKVVGSDPCWSGGRIFFSRVNFLCWLLFWYLFHPRVTAAAGKRPWLVILPKSAGGRLQLNTHTPYICGFAWSDMVHGCMVYTENAEMAAVSCGTSHASAVSTPLGWIFKNALWKAIHSCRITCECSESAREWRIALYKSDQ